MQPADSKDKLMDSIPKIGEVKNLKDLSTVLVLPIICVCYLNQTDFSIKAGDIEFMVNSQAAIWVQVVQFVLIFIGKTLCISLVALLAYVALSYADIQMDNILVPIIVLVLLTFGLTGVFSPEKIPFIRSLKPLWFYASFVVSFFLLSHQDRINNGT